MKISKAHSSITVRNFAPMILLLALMVGTGPDSSPQNLQAPPDRACTVWSYGYFTGVERGFNWGDWYYTNFPDNCDFDRSLNVICSWPDPNSACAAWVLMNQQTDKNHNLKLGTYVPIQIATYPVNRPHPITRPCRFRTNGALDSRQTTVSEEPFQREAHCTPNPPVLGPYSNCSNSYTGKNNQLYYFGYRGAKFAEVSQRDLILQLNKDKPENLNQIKSDVNETSIPGFTSTCQGGELHDPKFAASNDKCAAEVHHLVPRTDTQGCPCGTNSFKNAIVVSRELNNWIRSNPNKAQLLINLLPLPYYTNRGICKPKPNLGFLFNPSFPYGEFISAGFWGEFLN